jgi:polysulfide reductase chain C
VDITWGASIDEVAWGGIIAFYLFLAGIAGGAFLTASLTDLLSKKDYSKVIRSGAYIAPVTIVIGLGLLVVDLGRPLTFWKLLLNVNLGSVMSIGVFIISAFSALSVVYAYLVWSSPAIKKQSILYERDKESPFLAAEAEMAMTSDAQGLQAFRKPVAALGALFSIGTATYTGFLLSAVTTSNFWYTSFLGIEGIPFLPILFLVSASSTGIAATLIGALKSKDLTAYKKIDTALIVIELVLLAILYLSVKPIFFSGSMALPFWLGVVVIGLILPLLLSIYSLMKHKNVILPVSGLVIIGGFFLRYFVVYTGQLFR